MKLVRDNIPALYERGQLEPREGDKGDITFRPVRDSTEYQLLLRLKLAEEVGEVLSAPTRETLISELGDLLDVIATLETALDVTLSERRSRLAKTARLGGFHFGRVLE